MRGGSDAVVDGLVAGMASNHRYTSSAHNVYYVKSNYYLGSGSTAADTHGGIPRWFSERLQTMA